MSEFPFTLWGNHLLLIEFIHRVTSLLQVWRTRLQVTQKLMTALAINNEQVKNNPKMKWNYWTSLGTRSWRSKRWVNIRHEVPGKRRLPLPSASCQMFAQCLLLQEHVHRLLLDNNNNNSMKLTWNFQRSGVGGFKPKHLPQWGMDMFWNTHWMAYYYPPCWILQQK